jgi:hypothetical protein
MQIRVTNIHRRSNGTVDMDVYRRKAFRLRRKTTNQILRGLGRSVLPRLIGAIAILVSYVLFLPRYPLPQAAGSTFAPVSLLPGSLKASKWNHRSQ